MRPVHADGMSRAAREIQRHAAGERAAVIDDDGDGLPIAGIGHRHPRSEWQGAVRSGMATGIERLAAGGAATGGIPGRDHLSACASAFRPHMGKNHAKPRLENSLIGAMSGPDVFADIVRTSPNPASTRSVRTKMDERIEMTF